MSIRTTSTFQLFLLSFLAAAVFVFGQGADKIKPIKALMITGGCCHEYDKQKFILSQGISARANVEWTIVHQGGSTTNTKIPYYQNKDWHKGFDVVLHNECFASVGDKAFVENILKPHRDGLPSLVVHCAMHSYRENGADKLWKPYLGVDTMRHGPHYAFRVDNVKPEHPVMSEFGKSWMTPKGELYHIEKVFENVTPLGTATRKDGKTKDVVIWVHQYGKGRVFGTTIGHHAETMEQPEYLDLVTRGLLWSVGKLDNPDYTEPAAAFVAKQIGEVSKPGSSTPQKLKKMKKVSLLENLALNAAASGSPHQAGRDHKFAFDGQTDTRWCGPNNDAGHTLQVDLGGLKKLRGARILWEQENRPYQYKIEGSADGKTWNMLSDQSARKDRVKLHELAFEAYDIRHVRLTPTKLEGGAWGSIWEMEVLGDKKVKRFDTLRHGSAATPAGRNASGGKMTVPAGYTGAMFGGPDLLGYPACLTIGSDGWLYAGLDPNGSLGKDPKHNGSIVRARDSDGDGVADEFQTCVEGVHVPPLNTFNPRGLFVHGNKMIVLHPPELSQFTDTDGDGTFEDRKVLVKDISTPELIKGRGADHCTNGFTPGIDGWLYIAVGDFGFIKAVGSDGKELQLECFTRDNTNDGGGWNVRLSHVIGGEAEYGYPYLFKNFPEDRIPRLEDYGGGSPCGSLWLDEPGESGLFTCDWGRSIVYRHPLKANGADYTSSQQDFIKIPRPTDMDVDFDGRLYVSSWNGGSFRYSDDSVGFVGVAIPDAAASTAPTTIDFADADEAELIALLRSDSHKKRLHAQWELVDRKATSAIGELLNIASHRGNSDAVRAAALFTMVRLDPERAQDRLHALARQGNDNIRAMTLRALADKDLGAASSTAAVKLLADNIGNHSKTRVQAAIGLGRLGNAEIAAPALIKALGDKDPLVRHAAVKSLGHLNATDACLAALPNAQDETVRGGLLQVLDGLHSKAVVDGLIASIDTAEPDAGSLKALCRLYHKEGTWEGKWWGTRPDTRGPYYKPETWEQTPVIAAALQQAMNKNEASKKLLLAELPRHRIKLEGVTKLLLATAQSDPAFADKALDVLLDESKVPAEAIGFLRGIGMDAEKTGQRRGQAVLALDKIDTSGNRDSGPAAAKAALDVFASIGPDAEKGFRGARSSYVRSGKRARDIDVFIERAKDSPDALAIVAAVADNQRGDKNAREKALAHIEGAIQDETQAIAILDAVGGLKLGSFEAQIRQLAGDERPTVAKRATQVAKNLKIDLTPVDPTKLIAQVKYEDVLKVVNSTKGDPKAGATFYLTTGCIACHTVKKDEPLKGPARVRRGNRNPQHRRHPRRDQNQGHRQTRQARHLDDAGWSVQRHQARRSCVVARVPRIAGEEEIVAAVNH